MGIALPCTQPAPNPVVLVVDDEPLIRAVVADWLADNGYRVLEAADGEQAIAELERNTDVALVFSDICMAGPEDGVALAAWVCANRPDVTMILASAECYGAASVPGVRFFAKPYNLNDVVQCITAELQRKTKFRLHIA
jgi:two-component system, response regulator PdtaR